MRRKIEFAIGFGLLLVAGCRREEQPPITVIPTVQAFEKSNVDTSVNQFPPLTVFPSPSQDTLIESTATPKPVVDTEDPGDTETVSAVQEAVFFTEEQEKIYQEIEGIYSSIGMKFFWSREMLLELSKSENNVFIPQLQLTVDKNIPQNHVENTLKMWGTVFQSERLLGIIDGIKFWPTGYAGYSYRHIHLNLDSCCSIGYDRSTIWHELTHAISAHQDHSGFFTLDELLQLELLQAKIITSTDKSIIGVYNETYSNTSDGRSSNPLYYMGVDLVNKINEGLIQSTPADSHLLAKFNEFSSDGFSDHDYIKLSTTLIEFLEVQGYHTMSPEVQGIYQKHMQSIVIEVIANWVGHNVRNGVKLASYPESRDLVEKYLTVAAGRSEQINLDDLDNLFRYNLDSLDITIPYSTQ
ncbi:MAG: hypothetical protein WAU07_03870 [Microgenomates group bacterium]